MVLPHQPHPRLSQLVIGGGAAQAELLIRVTVALRRAGAVGALSAQRLIPGKLVQPQQAMNFGEETPFRGIHRAIRAGNDEERTQHLLQHHAVIVFKAQGQFLSEGLVARRGLAGLVKSATDHDQILRRHMEGGLEGIDFPPVHRRITFRQLGGKGDRRNGE